MILPGFSNHLDGITVALCTSDYRILFLNRAFEKAAHLHSIPDDLSLHDYVDLDQERLSTISREKLVSFYNVVMKPDNRRYKVTILSAGDYRIFVGEQSDPNDTDMMSAMSALSQ